ncbi:MAG: serine/threonine-protein kinase [Vicinamibacterales bacterium]
MAPLLMQATRLSDAEAKDLVDSAALDAVVRGEIMDLLRISGASSGSSGNRETMPPGAESPQHSTFTAFKPGEAIERGRFVIVRQIGRGGMGAVYLAQDTALGTLVALKFVPPDDRLIQEAQRAAACAGHEHVATVHNVLQTEHAGERIGVLVMEHVAGRSASRILDDGPIPIPRAIAWMRQAASAVAHAHDSEVLHCDLKPANMIVTPDDRVKVLDFGIARRSFDRTNPHQPTFGTLPYMAPEQLLNGECSRATDVYSLGVTLFELVTGRLPFTGDDRMVAMQILAAPHPKVSELLPGSSPEFDTVVDRALARDPADRFRSARALVQALEELQHKEDPSPADPQPNWLRTAVSVTVALVAITWVFGVAAARYFEVFLRVDAEFTASVFDYFRIGWAAILPFLQLWVLASAATAAAAGLVLLLRKLASHRRRVMSDRTRRLNPQTLAITALLVGVATWLAVLWSNRDLFGALVDLHQNPATASIDAISFSARPKHLTFATDCALLSFILLLAAVAWFRRPSRASERSAFSRTLGWALLSLALLVALSPTMPRRFLFERFRVVEYDGRRAVMIGSARDDLLLFDSERRVTIRVRRDASGLRVTEMTRQIFED